MSTFRPPVAFDNPGTYRTYDPRAPYDPLADRLFSHFGGNPRGRTVLKIGGVYGTYDVPSQDLIDTATEVYLGGHIYQVTTAVAAALTAAGYGDGIS